MSPTPTTVGSGSNSIVEDKAHVESLPVHHVNVENGHREYHPAFNAVARPKRAAAGPLGLFSFATVTAMMSLIHVHARGVHKPNMVMGMAFCVGGGAQFVAGLLEFVNGNTFAMTAFCSYGAYWLGNGIFYWPTSGMITAYETTEDMYQARGLLMAVWMAFSLMMFFGALRTNVGLALTLIAVVLTFMLQCIGYLAVKEAALVGSGWTGFVAAALAYYMGCAEMYAVEGVPFTLPNPRLGPEVV